MEQIEKLNEDAVYYVATFVDAGDDIHPHSGVFTTEKQASKWVIQQIKDLATDLDVEHDDIEYSYNTWTGDIGYAVYAEFPGFAECTFMGTVEKVAMNDPDRYRREAWKKRVTMLQEKERGNE